MSRERFVLFLRSKVGNVRGIGNRVSRRCTAAAVFRMGAGMERREFATIVKKLEGRAKRLPRMYRLGVLAQAVFGTIFFHLLFLVAVLAIGGAAFLLWRDGADSGWAAIVIVAALFPAGFAIRALSFRFEPPRGVEATRERSAALWRMIDEQRATLRAGRVHQVLLTSEFGASIVQTPRRGMIFGYRTTLMCGVPLMLHLDAAQFATVVAHELGHLAGKHGAASAWGYRVQRVWMRVLEQTQGRPGHPMAKFAKWFVPRFNARSIVLCRAMEHRADQASADVCGVDCVGDTLLRAYLLTPPVQKFWERTWRRAGVEKNAPVGVFHDLAKLEESDDEAALRDELARELAVRTQPESTHPSLTERLAALGYFERHGTTADVARAAPVDAASRLPLPPASKVSAARTLYGERYEVVLTGVGEAWATDVGEIWDQRHAEMLMNRGKLALLDQMAAAGTLSPDDAVDRARIVEFVEGDERLLAVIEEAVALHPSNASAHFQKGRVLLERHDAAGVASLDRAMQLDPTSTDGASALIRVYHAHRNDHDEAEQAARRADQESRRIAMAEQERGYISADSDVQAHDLPAQDVRRLVAILRTLAWAERAYLVRRAVQHYPELPAYALLVFVKPSLLPWVMRRRVAFVHYELRSRMRYTDRHAVQFVLGNDQSALALRGRFKRSPQYCVYDARRKSSGGVP